MKLAKDKKLWIPDNEEWMNWSLNYEIKHWREVVMHIKSTRTAIDIGAHVGIWTRRMAEIFDNVQAFEPVPKHVQCNIENLKKYSNVTYHQIALSNKVGIGEMKEMDYNSGLSTLEWKILPKRKTKHKQRQINVHLNTLDEYKLKDVDFIKIDVEGHEVNVIRGAEETLENNSPIVFIEVLHKELKKAYTALDALKDLGYSQIMHVGSGNYIFKKL